MKNQLWLVLLFSLGLSSCSKENEQIDNLNGQWTLMEYTNILGQVSCRYEEGEVMWSFDDDKVKINGRLVTPWEYTPCYKVESDYNEELTFTIAKSDGDNIINIEELNLKAKITVEEELIIEVISSTDFKPSTAGIKVFFKKM